MRPLSGIRVLELGHIVAGPTASLILAEFGADVIKVEHPNGGDQARVNRSNQGHFVSYNSNKRSICLDLSTQRGREVLVRLLQRSDVLLDNFSPGAIERLGFGPEELRTLNPRLVHCAIKGFLPGPAGHLPLTDEPAQMRGGLAYMTGPEGRPLRAGTSVVDLTGALFAALAVMVALREREETGAGRQVHVGLFESVAFLVGQHISKASMTGAVPLPMPQRGMGRDLGWGIYRPFATREGRDIFVAVLSDAHWERFCAALDFDELWADPTLRTNAGRAEQHERLTEAVAARISTLDRGEAIRRMEDAKLPCAPINTPADLLEDPHLTAIDFLKSVTAPDGTPARIASLPIAAEGWFSNERRDPPALGADTAAILAEIGLADAATATDPAAVRPESKGTRRHG